MRIVYNDFTGMRKSPRMQELRGLGASDRAALEIPELLASFGNDVVFHTKVLSETVHNRVRWKNEIDDSSKECDVLIVHRSPFYTEKMKYKKMIYYVHDDIDAPALKNAKSFLKIPDHFIVLSEYHKKRLIDFGAPEEKITIIPEGIDFSALSPSPVRVPGSMCYASAPFKGLPLLLKLWPKIKELIPHATLHVLGDMYLYGSPEQNHYFRVLYNQMHLDNSINFHGTLTNKEALKIIGSCQLMVYPNFFPETYCAVAAESIASYTPVITSSLGALPETVQGCGICVAGDPKSADFQDTFVRSVEEALTSHKMMVSMLEQCDMRMSSRGPNFHSWRDVAKKIEDLCERLLHEI